MITMLITYNDVVEDSYDDDNDHVMIAMMMKL